MTRLFSSLRARFLAAILIWVALGIGALWFSSVRLFSSHVEQQYHEELEVHVRELAELTVLDAAGNPACRGRCPIRAMRCLCPDFTGRSGAPAIAR